MSREAALRFAGRMMKERDEAERTTEYLNRELRSMMLIQYILVQRLGGTVDVTQAELEAARGRIAIAHNKEDALYRIFALDPDEEEQEAPETTDDAQEEGSARPEADIPSSVQDLGNRGDDAVGSDDSDGSAVEGADNPA